MPVDARVSALAAAIASRHVGASRAVLFYGSCLREKKLEGLMLDFYLIVSSYREAYDKRWLAAANRLIPPNVFYFEKDGIAAKYAVLSEGDFYRLNGPETRSVSVWARFAQPSRLVWAANEQARERAIEAVSRAAPTLLEAAGARGRRKAARLVAQGLCADLFGGAPRGAERARRVIRRSGPPALHPVHGASGCCDRPPLQGQLAPPPRRGKASLRRPVGQGERDVRRRRGLYRVEDQPARGDKHSPEAVAATPSAPCRDQPLTAADPVRGGSLAVRARAAETALASAPTVNGLRSSSCPRSSSLSPSPT